MALTVSTDETGDIPVVNVSGDIDVATAAPMRDAIDALMVAGHRRLVLDLSGVTFIDSTGLGVIVGRLKGLRRGGGAMAVVASHERVLRVLDITGLDTVLPVTADLDGALDALSGA